MSSALRESGVRPVVLGTALWAVGLVVAVVTGGAWHNPWFWTCVVALICGALGIPWLQRRHRRLVAAGGDQSSEGSSAG